MPYYLTCQDIIDINIWCQKIVEHSAIPTDGIREYNLLKSIPEAIKQSFAGEKLYPTIYDKGTYLWFSLSQCHCFVDGNKRTALVATVVYLILNGYTVKNSMDDLYNTCIRIANGTMKHNEIAIYLMRNIAKNDRGSIGTVKSITDVLNSLSKYQEFILVLEKLGQ